MGKAKRLKRLKKEKEQKKLLGKKAGDYIKFSVLFHEFDDVESFTLLSKGLWDQKQITMDKTQLELLNKPFYRNDKKEPCTVADKKVKTIITHNHVINHMLNHCAVHVCSINDTKFIDTIRVDGAVVVGYSLKEVVQSYRSKHKDLSEYFKSINVQISDI